MLRRSLLFGFCLSLLSSVSAEALSPGQKAVLLSRQSAFPGDILARAGTPAVAAHSVTRRLFAAYSGPLFQLQRTSDNATLNVGSFASGVANTTPIAAFCASTTCNFSNIYDQTGNGNNLPQTTAANQVAYSTKTLASGLTVPVAATTSGHYFRNRTSTHSIPTGASTPTTEYMVVDTSVSNSCCGTYGNMETTVSDTGNGHMFALAYSTGAAGSLGTAPGPWAGADWENGVYLYGAGPNANAKQFTVLAKYNPTGPSWVLKAADQTAPIMTTLYNGANPSGYTAAFEGGLSLGEGGDGTAAPIDFYEGIVTSTDTTDATDNAIQARIQAFYGNPAGVYCNNLNSLVSYPLDLFDGSHWSQSGLSSITAATDLYGGNLAALLTGSGNLYANISQYQPSISSTTYTFTDYILATSGATVFPGGSIGDGSTEYAWVLNTNTGAIVSGTWGSGASTLTSSNAGLWWRIKMIFVSPVSSSGTFEIFLDPPIANGSGVRGPQTAGLTTVHFCPTLTKGAN